MPGRSRAFSHTPRRARGGEQNFLHKAKIFCSIRTALLSKPFAPPFLFRRFPHVCFSGFARRSPVRKKPFFKTNFSRKPCPEKRLIKGERHACAAPFFRSTGKSPTGMRGLLYFMSKYPFATAFVNAAAFSCSFEYSISRRTMSFSSLSFVIVRPFS